MSQKKLHFYKVSATGNKFALVDLRTQKAELALPELARRMSSELATDGMVAIRGWEKGKHLAKALRMDFFNPDGSQAFCGNGTRSTGFYEIFMKGKKKKGRIEVKTIDGPRLVEVSAPWSGLLKVPNPSIERTLKVDFGTAHHVEAGCPHAVIFVDSVKNQDVQKIGSQIRYSEAFKPAGTNVDFVQVLSPSSLKIRTYERGVERETGSCGSGAMASAAMAKNLGKIKGDVCRLETEGGELRVRFSKEAPEISLEGTVKVLMEGFFYV